MSAFYLDGPLYYLGRNRPDTFDLLMLVGAQGKAALLFRERALAESHLPRLPQDIHAQAVPAEDFRAKEELLRGALAEGAALIWLDAGPEKLEPSEQYLSQEALNYILSFKNEVSCI